MTLRRDDDRIRVSFLSCFSATLSLSALFVRLYLSAACGSSPAHRAPRRCSDHRIHRSIAPYNAHAALLKFCLFFDLLRMLVVIAVLVVDLAAQVNTMVVWILYSRGCDQHLDIHRRC